VDDLKKTSRELTEEIRGLASYMEGGGRARAEGGQVENELRSSHERLNILFESAPDGIYLNDLAGVIVDGNKAAEELIGYARAELIGRSFAEAALLSAEQMPKVAENLQRNAQGEPTGPDEFTLRKKDGGFVTVEIRTFPVTIDGRALSLGIARDITKRKRSEEALRYRMEFGKLISTLSTWFIEPGGVAEKIDDALKAIGEFAGVDRAYIFEFRDDGKTVDNTHEWCGEGIASKIEKLKGISLEEDFPWFCRYMKAHKILHVPSVASLPPEAKLEREHFEGQDIRALIVVPMVFQGQLMGFLGFDSVRFEKRWREDIIGLLRIAGENILRALVRKRTEDALRASEEHYRMLAETMNDGLIELDENGRYVYVNKRYGEMFGRHWTEFQGFSAEKTITPQSDIRKKPPVGPYEIATTARDGRAIHIRISPRAIFDENGKFKGSVAIIGDITESKKAEEVIRRHNEFLRNVLESLTYPFLVINADDYTVEMANSAACEGRLPEGVTCYMLSHKRDRPCDSPNRPCPLEKVKKTGQPMVMEHIHRDKQGNERNIEVHGYPVFDGDGNVSKMIEYCLDVTERKRIRKSLKRSESLLDVMGRIAKVGGWELDASTLELRWTKETYRIHEVPLDYVPSLEEAVNFYHPEDRPRLEQAIQRALEHGEPFDMEIRFITAKGKHLWIHMTCKPQIVDGKTVKLSGAFQDITKRKNSEKLARRHQAEMFHVSRLSMMGEMASGLAHELNQPLCAILSCSDMCSHMAKDGNPDIDRLNKGLELIASQAERAGEIVRRIRDFVQKRETNRTSVDINNIVQEAIGLIDADIRHSQTVVDLRLSRRLPMVLGDVIQIEQVLLNLMRNAIEVMQSEDREERRLTIETTAGPEKVVEIAVSDTGPGLAPQASEKLFDSFHTTKPDGLGIGLAICRSIIEAHEGEIWAEPDTGGGAVFKFTLPIVATASQFVD